MENFGKENIKTRVTPEWPGIIVDGKHVHRDDLTMEILEGVLNGASPERRDSIVQMIIAKGKELELDNLTGLSNRSLLRPKINRLRERLDYKGEDHERASKLDSILVVSIDLVGLKFFNEAPYDHSKGDDAIKAFANRLREVLKREGDSAFRIGGDEFLLVLPIDSNSDSAEKVYERVKKDLTKGLHIEGEKDKLNLLIQATFGHTVSKKGDTRTVEELIKDADSAERKAKSSLR
jgi:diguanylate cyclase (GGDEF)-like protein